jgi:hypothetical protein
MTENEYNFGADMEIAFFIVLTNFILWIFFSA